MTVTAVIPSYLYTQYADDADLPNFVLVFNQLAQEYVDWFNGTPLPVYTDPAISGLLLDWVAAGLYGLRRPTLSSGQFHTTGPYNAALFNKLPYNASKKIGTSAFYATNDDIFKRCLTWAFYKGDGKNLNIRWLKRRIMRFLAGANGTSDSIDQTYQVSVTFTGPAEVTITILPGDLVLSAAETLKEAIESGVLELPFQFTYVVVT